MEELSQPAQFALMSLRRNPRHDTADAIADGPMSIQQINTQDVQRGLAELEAAGLAEQRAGAWRLTAKAADV